MNTGYAMPIDPDFQMWATFGVIIVALFLYATERVSLELTSIGVIVFLLIFFHFFPLDAPGREPLDAQRLLAGFADPALAAVVALLIIGQGLARTGAIDQIAHYASATKTGPPLVTLTLMFLIVAVLSAFLNNTPVVVIFIPIIQTLAQSLGRSASSVLIPLSYVAILGGMTTLIGSSTNLLVSGALVNAGYEPFSMFEFTVPAAMLAVLGFFYASFLLPRMLPDRASLASALIEDSGKQFIAQVTVTRDSKLIGAEARGGFFPSLKDVTVRLIQRGEHAFVPPFENVSIRRGDILVLAATRKALTEVLKQDAGLRTGEDFVSPSRQDSSSASTDRMLAEVMIAPASRMLGQNLEQIGFRYKYNCIVLGIQRRSRMIRARVSEIRLEAGDVLLIQGHPDDVMALRGNPDMVLMEWSAAYMPSPHYARRATLIFLAVVLFAALDLVPIVISALAGVVAMIAADCLNVRQASRAIDRRIVLLIAAALGMGSALAHTGGAAFLANAALTAFGDGSPLIIVSAFFLLVALLTNVLSNNATAVLFTPIAVSLSAGLGIEIHIMAITVLLAANCSFASPIGYQTNMLVMGPGHYRFVDFARGGLPLVLLTWLAYTALLHWYYGVQ